MGGPDELVLFAKPDGVGFDNGGMGMLLDPPPQCNSVEMEDKTRPTSRLEDESRSIPFTCETTTARETR